VGHSVGWRRDGALSGGLGPDDGFSDPDRPQEDHVRDVKDTGNNRIVLMNQPGPPAGPCLLGRVRMTKSGNGHQGETDKQYENPDDHDVPDSPFARLSYRRELLSAPWENPAARQYTEPKFCANVRTRPR